MRFSQRTMTKNGEKATRKIEKRERRTQFTHEREVIDFNLEHTEILISHIEISPIYQHTSHRIDSLITLSSTAIASTHFSVQQLEEFAA
jgi:predicted ATP-dependent serine protease